MSLMGPYWHQYYLTSLLTQRVGLTQLVVDDTKLVDMPEERDAIQRDLDRRERWAYVNLTNLMNFNKARSCTRS